MIPELLLASLSVGEPIQADNDPFVPEQTVPEFVQWMEERSTLTEKYIEDGAPTASISFTMGGTLVVMSAIENTPSETDCYLSLHPSWTEGSIMMEDRACIGEMANFHVFDEYQEHQIVPAEPEVYEAFSGSFMRAVSLVNRVTTKSIGLTLAGRQAKPVEEIAAYNRDRFHHLRREPGDLVEFHFNSFYLRDPIFAYVYEPEIDELFVHACYAGNYSSDGLWSTQYRFKVSSGELLTVRQGHVKEIGLHQTFDDRLAEAHHFGQSPEIETVPHLCADTQTFLPWIEPTDLQVYEASYVIDVLQELRNVSTQY